MGVVLLAGVASFALLGALSGAVFSVVVALAEGKERVETLRWRWIAAWGVVGAVLPVVVILADILFVAHAPCLGPWVISTFAISSTLGFASAVGMLALARRTQAIDQWRMQELE